MKFFSALTLAAFLPLASAAFNPDLWAMGDAETWPTVAYDPAKEEFTLSFEHGATDSPGADNGKIGGNGEVVLQVWSECPNGEPPANENAVKIHNTNGGTGIGNSLGDDSSNYFAFTNAVSVDSTNAEDKKLTQTTTFSFTIGAGVAKSAYYSEKDNRGVWEVCFRAGLRMANPKKPGKFIIMNFREIVFSAEYDFTNSFEFSNFQTQAYDPVQDDGLDDIKFDAVAKKCAGEPLVYNQGSTLCIEICAVSEQVIVKSIQNMTVTEEPAPASDDIDEEVIWFEDADSKEAMMGTFTVGQEPGAKKGCVETKFFLRANYYPRSTLSTPINDPQNNKVIGDVILTWAPTSTRRRLQEAREESAEFTTFFEIAPVQETSGAVGSVGAAAAAAGLGAAALLL